MNLSELVTQFEYQNRMIEEIERKIEDTKVNTHYEIFSNETQRELDLSTSELLRIKCLGAKFNLLEGIELQVKAEHGKIRTALNTPVSA